MEGGLDKAEAAYHFDTTPKEAAARSRGISVTVH